MRPSQTSPSPALVPTASAGRRSAWPSWTPAVALFLVALAVRLAGISWGLPTAERWYSYHPDESTRQLVGAIALHLMQGDFNPHFFNYPSLVIYLTWATHLLLSALGVFAPAAPGPYPWETVRDIILAGRLVSAVLGAGTVVLLYALARHLGMKHWAVWAALVLALLPGHLQHSHFATVDIPATFLVMACVYLTARAVTWRGLLVAALVAGLAASAKYNAILVLLVPLMAVFYPVTAPNTEDRQARPRPPLLALPLMILASVAGFVLATPYSLLSFQEFWGDGRVNGVAYELLVHPREGSGELFEGTGMGWWYHLSFNLPYLAGWPLALAALLGMWCTRRQRELWPLLAFTGLYFVVTSGSQVRFMRYLLPLAPLLALYAALWVRSTKTPRILGTVLLPCALWGAWTALLPFVKTDPRDLALQAARESGKTPVLVGNPWFYTPALQPRGDNVPVEGLRTIGWNAAAFDPSREVLVLSDYEWREAVRLRPGGPEAQFLQAVSRKSASRLFGTLKAGQDPALPGPYVPHDYLYTNPGTRVFGQW